MINILYLSNIIRMYFMIRTLHGVYVSYVFLQWIIENIYSGFIWIVSYFPKPSLQLEDKELYYEIETNDYIFITSYVNI